MLTSVTKSVPQRLVFFAQPMKLFRLHRDNRKQVINPRIVG